MDGKTDSTKQAACSELAPSLVGDGVQDRGSSSSQSHQEDTDGREGATPYKGRIQCRARLPYTSVRRERPDLASAVLNERGDHPAEPDSKAHHCENAQHADPRAASIRQLHSLERNARRHLSSLKSKRTSIPAVRLDAI